MEFIWPVRVYYEDTDAGGVVYYANYLKFYERARSEWLNQLGVDQATLLQQDIAFVVRKADLDYILPARLNDELQVVTRIVSLTGASLVFEQKIFTKDKSKLLNTAQIKVACLKLKSFTPCRIPATIKKEFQRVS